MTGFHQSARVIVRNHLTNKLGKHFQETLPENGCLENEFPFGMAHFQVLLLSISGRGNSQNLNVLWTLWVTLPLLKPTSWGMSWAEVVRICHSKKLRYIKVKILAIRRKHLSFSAISELYRKESGTCPPMALTRITLKLPD